MIPDKSKITEGEFTYTYDDPCLGGPVQTTYTWGISEYDLEKDHGRHLMFTYKFSGAKGEPQNTVSIAIDWEAGLAEGVKITPGK